MVEKGNIPWNKGKKGSQVAWNKGIPFSEETRKRMSEAKKGKKQTVPFTQERKDAIRARRIGKKHTEESKLKMSINRTGKMTKENHFAYGKEKSIETRTKLSNTRKDLGIAKGKNNPAWKGGITPLYHLIRSCPEYNQWRLNIYERDNYCDWYSGVKGNGNLNVHHIMSFKKILKQNNITTIEQALKCEALWDTNNGITLIESNHEAHHNMW